MKTNTVVESRLLAKARRPYAQAWIAQEEGDAIEGVVVELSTGAHEQYGTYPIIVLDVEDDFDQRAVHCFHTVLRDQLAQKDVKVGDRVAIVYLGKVPSPTSGNTYHNYRMVTESA